MSRFSFNAPANTQPSTTTGFSFGAPKTTAVVLPTFGATAPTSAFSGPTATAAFAAPGAISTFGAPAATPAFGATATTSAFGATAAAPTFGAPTGTSAFGTPAGTSAFGTPAGASAFGAPAAGFASPAATSAFAAPAATPVFGATTTTPAFTAPAAAQGFGAPTATPGFGATSVFAAPATAAPAFGTTTPAASTFGLQSAFAGTTAVSAAPTFGATPVSAAPSYAAAVSGNVQPLSLGAQTTTVGFGTTAVSAPPPAFGSTTATASSIASNTQQLTGAPAFSFGTNNTQPSTLSLGGAPNTTFNFAPKPAATSASLTFGTATSTATAFALSAPSAGANSLGIFGRTTSTTATTAATTTTTPFVGLGGADLSGTQAKPGDSKQDIMVKETLVPEEITKTVQALKTHIKTQKTMASDIGRTSTTRLTTLSNEIMGTHRVLQKFISSVEANYEELKVLHLETSKTIQAVEMAQRTQETPAGLQLENVAPLQYFQQLTINYELDMTKLRQQIAFTERHMESLANPKPISPEALHRCMREINESFVSLAGRLHEIHQKVHIQKDQYLNLRKHRLGDSTNVFAELEKAEVNDGPGRLRVFTGPTPFPKIGDFGKSHISTTATAGSGNTTVPKSIL